MSYKVKFKDITINLDKRRKPLNGADREKISIKKLYPYCGANSVMDYVDEYLFDEEILCVAEDGGKWGKNETCSYIMNEKCWVNNHAHVIKVKENVDIRYLKHWLNYSNLNSYITGAIVRKLTQKELNELEIFLPDKSEQIKTSDVIDKCEEIIDIRKKQIEQLDESIKSQFVKMFENNKYEQKSLKDIANIGSSKRIYANEYRENGIPFYRSKEIRELGSGLKPSTELFISKEKYNEVKRKYGIPKKGDILIAAIGATIGYMWIVDDSEFYYKDGNLILVSSKSGTNPIYLKYTLEKNINQFKRNGASGSAQLAMTIEKVENFIISMPPIELQNQFAEFVKQVNKQKSVIQKSLEETQKLQESLMNKYFG